jgi:tetratricopeptide (TPR) repeat protein
MKRWYWIALAVVVVVAAGVTLVAVPRAPEWTTSSPEALAEFEAGQAAYRKVYHDEAREHFKKAYDLDQDFLVAKLRVAGILRGEDPERADLLVSELMTADLSKLTPREQFFIEYWRANRNNQEDEAARLLDECVEKHPDDPYVLYEKAGVAWRRGNLEDAERLYQGLLAIEPNWVVGHNALGYIKMIQERFAEAEEHFKSYRFIAPDQANPHDSLGELYITIGRYEDAETTLERAIEIKPDFWASYFHLALLKAYARDFEAVRGVIERARVEGIGDEHVFEMNCSTHFTELADRAAWQEILDEHSGECVEKYKLGLPSLITHRAACRTGDWDVARKLEDDASGLLLEIEKSGNDDAIFVAQASTLHMQGVRLATQGDFAAAVDRFRAVDGRLSFMYVEQGMYKLYNRLLEAETLLAVGKDSEAHKVIAHIRGINPELVREFEDTRFRFLGLGRGESSFDTAAEQVEPDGTTTAM